MRQGAQEFALTRSIRFVRMSVAQAMRVTLASTLRRIRSFAIVRECRPGRAYQDGLENPNPPEPHERLSGAAIVLSGCPQGRTGDRWRSQAPLGGVVTGSLAQNGLERVWWGMSLAESEAAAAVDRG